LSSARLSVTELLDDAEEAVARVMAPWGGVLWLCALPFRMLQAHFVDRVFALGDAASGYGAHLLHIAVLASASAVPWMLGRLAFVRACRVSLQSGRAPGAEPLHIGFGTTASFLYVAAALEIGFVLTAPTFLAIPFFVLLSGLAAAAAPLQTGPGFFAPWRQLSRQLRHGRVLLAFLLLFGCAFVIVLANLYALCVAGHWLAQAWPGFDAGAWDAVLSYRNRSFWLMLGVGSALVVEPFWLAALTTYVQAALSRETGDDLRTEWARLRATVAS
jgi:hypothetical protein